MHSAVTNFTQAVKYVQIFPENFVHNNRIDYGPLGPTLAHLMCIPRCFVNEYPTLITLTECNNGIIQKLPTWS
jgi:hypothetical protein